MGKPNSYCPTIQRGNHANAPDVQRGQNDFQQAVKAERRIEMPQIELTWNEIEMLRGILQKQLTELSMETAFTHRRDFHEFLKRRKEFMEGFVGRLERELASGRREVGQSKS